MNPIERLTEQIERAYPQVELVTTAPLHSDGVWSLDIALEDLRLVVEWAESIGFLLSNGSPENFGEGADEKHASREGVQERIFRLLECKARPTPPIGRLLGRLRERLGISQSELAAKIGVKQSTVSGIEARQDIQISTLRRIVSAFGGQLEVFVVVGSDRYPVEGRLAAPTTPERTEGDFTPLFIPETAFETLKKKGEFPEA